jgi:hypothetical protein
MTLQDVGGLPDRVHSPLDWSQLIATGIQNTLLLFAADRRVALNQGTDRLEYFVHHAGGITSRTSLGTAGGDREVVADGPASWAETRYQSRKLAGDRC